KDLVAAGTFDIPVTAQLIENKIVAGNKTALRINYTTDGEDSTLIIPKGQTLKLSKDKPKPVLVLIDNEINWMTPDAGAITYTNSSGKTKTTKVKSVPKPMKLSGAWEVSFPPNLGAPSKAIFDKLIAWTDATAEGIQHFSGTATYRKEFVLSDNFLQADQTLELDLGSVAIIAEVIINSKNVGTLWKAPFRIHIDDFVKEGVNTLEIKVTNLWVNRLIGDEKRPLDIERKGDKTTSLPDWLINEQARPSGRLTFPSWKHWAKDDELLTSGLLGPVKINVFHKIKL
ncbi:MAG: glycosylhydrolase-like jelly roll fold domain-containing protein, partial [Saprospiraceae bacterium]